MFAVEENHTEVVAYLLQNSAKVDLIDEVGYIIKSNV